MPQDKPNDVNKLLDQTTNRKVVNPSDQKQELDSGSKQAAFVTQDQFNKAVGEITKSIDGVKRGSQGLVDKSAQRLQDGFQATLKQKYANIDFVSKSLKGTANELSEATVQSLQNNAIKEAIMESGGEQNIPDTPLGKMDQAAKDIQDQKQQPGDLPEAPPAHIMAAANILEAYGVDTNDFPESKEIDLTAEPQDLIKQVTAAAIKYAARTATQQADNTLNKNNPNNQMLSGGNQFNTPGNPIADVVDPDILLEQGMKEKGLLTK